jgi:hypothetical protein
MQVMIISLLVSVAPPAVKVAEVFVNAVLLPAACAERSSQAAVRNPLYSIAEALRVVKAE